MTDPLHDAYGSIAVDHDHMPGREIAIRMQLDLDKYRSFKRRSKFMQLILVLLGRV